MHTFTWLVEKTYLTQIVDKIPSTQGSLRCGLTFVHMCRDWVLGEHGNVLVVDTGTRGVGLHGQPSCTCSCKWECANYICNVEPARNRLVLWVQSSTEVEVAYAPPVSQESDGSQWFVHFLTVGIIVNSALLVHIGWGYFGPIDWWTFVFGKVHQLHGWPF